MPELHLTYLNRPDVEALALTDDEILARRRGGAARAGPGRDGDRAARAPRPGRGVSTATSTCCAATSRRSALAGVKVVGDYVDNYKLGLPSEMGLLNLFDPRTGVPLAVIDAAGLTDMRTGAVTALGARHLARADARVLGHVGARGTAYWNVRLLDHLFDFDEIRVHSRRPESREAFAARLERDLGKPVIVIDDWESCVRGADIVVEAVAPRAPEPLLRPSGSSAARSSSRTAR